MTIYSQLKVLQHRDRLADLQAGRPVTPVHVQLILSDLCNQDCSFCAYRMSSGLSTELFAAGELASHGHNNPRRWMDTDKAATILRECASLGVRAVQFTGGGEPTVHPEYRYLFRLARELGLETALVTNGVKLHPGDPGVLAMEWIRVSVDAGNAEQYARVRRVPEQHWAKVWANIRELGAIFAGRLGVGFVVTPQNYTGILDCARLAKDAGASNLRVGAVFSADGADYYGHELGLIEDFVAEAKERTDGDGFEVINLFGRRIGDLEDGHPTDAACGYQRLTWYIGGDLNVYRCCNTAYTRAGTVGSLATHTMRELIAAQAHEPFDARTCRHCQFLGQNRAIAAAVTPPEHANFV